ncbi:MAG TPA: Fe2+-dependent dioxygenase [Steroidobacteraceae bacterium]|nr:Fe2+-dependent dioxygenase [Steroidobacteraceae bacterium]
MFLQIPDLLSAAEVASLRQLAQQARFVDGRTTNPHNTTKINVIADQGDPAAQQASQIAFAALQRSEAAMNFALPARIAPPQLCRYGIGMTYGAHTDAAFLAVGPQALRSDVSCTVFLSEPGSYQGGELSIYLGTEIVRVKGAPGAAVLYPSTTLHEVAPVSAGERLVLITFIQSRVPDQMHRDLLYKLGEVRALEGLKMDWENRTQLEHVIANLQRMWAG